MLIELPETLEPALKAQAEAHGVTIAVFVREMVERHLTPTPEAESSAPPFKTGYGMLAKYGPAPSEEEIDANRAEMFRNFGESA